MSTHRIITVVGDEDFERLYENSGYWRDARDAGERFEGERKHPGRPWKKIYWMGGNYANVVLARSFLAAEGSDWEVLYDEAEYPSGENLGWVILTDYERTR